MLASGAMKMTILLCLLGLTLASFARAEGSLSVYSGWQTVGPGTVSGTQPGGGVFSGRVGWDGRSGEAPPYVGIRGTWWRSGTLGFGVEFTRAKASAPASDRPPGLSGEAFRDGHNIVTLNLLRRWPGRFGTVTPYLGGGFGLAVPDADLDLGSGEADPSGYRIAGPAGRVLAGLRYPVGARVSLFGEYQFTVSGTDIDLDGGGSLQADLATNALNLGLTLDF